MTWHDIYKGLRFALELDGEQLGTVDWVSGGKPWLWEIGGLAGYAATLEAAQRQVEDRVPEAAGALAFAPRRAS